MKNSPFLKIIQCAVLCLLAFTIVPERIYAEDNVDEKYVAYKVDKDGNETYYDNIPDAMNGSREEGAVIHMLKDWDIGAQINIVEGTKSTIYMDGHIIKKTNGEQSGDCEGGIFTIHPNAELFLYGSTDKKELVDSKGNTVYSGGLVTGGYAFHGGAIYMKEGAKLHLTNVAISGNKSEYKGGAIFIAKENCKIWMDDGHIDHNSAGTSGGGIYSDADGTRIRMDNHSTINYNQGKGAGSFGGGVAFYYSWFSIEGDGTAEVSYNELIPSEYGAGCFGGGISATEKKLATNSGVISGLTINGNVAGYGGGVDINPRNTVLKDVVITNNVARIEGGGVYVLYDVDVTLSGKVIIKDNKRGDSNSTNYDDLSLGTCFGIEAYILLNNLSSDSLIGIRTGTVNADRLVAKNVSDSSLLSCFFMDLNNSYHVGYSNKEIWQRTGVVTYAVKVNDKTIGSFSEGTRNITAVDNNTDSSKAFVSWQANNAAKLSGEQLNSDVISFMMPAGGVNLEANYITAAKDISLKVDELRVGESLPSTADIIWTFDYSCKMPVNIKWYKNTSTGYKEVAGDETVQEGVAYKFETIINKKLDGNLKLAFGNGLESKDIKVLYYDGSEIGIDSFSLNDKGTLSLTSGSVVAGSDKLAYVTPIVVSVDEGISKDDLISLINNSYKQTSATSINNKDYDVNIVGVDETTFSADMFNEEGKLKHNDQGYYRIDNVALDGYSDITTSIIINVSSIADVYRLTDEYEQDEANWYKTITLSGAWYSLDGNTMQQCYSNTCEIKLNGIKGGKVEHNFTVYQMDDYTLKPSGEYADYKYILDDSKIDAPKFNETTKSSDGDSSSLTVSAYSNLGTIYYLYNDSTNNWTIGKGNPVTLTNSEEAYKTYKVLSWSSNDTNVSDVSSNKYSIDNTKGIIGVNQIELSMDVPTLNQKFPTVINSIKACLNERTVDIANNVSITSWYPEHKSDTVDKECYYMANIKLDTLDQSSIDLLKNYDIKVVDSSNTYSYVDIQDGVSYLHIIFIKKGSFNNVDSNTDNNVDDSNKDTNRTVVSEPTCEEYMKSKDWTWSETKQKCVYKVSNTSVQ